MRLAVALFLSLFVQLASGSTLQFLNGLETSADRALVSISGGSAAYVAEEATEGATALRATLTASNGYNNIVFSAPPTYWNASQAGGASIDVYNPSNEALYFGMRAEDATGNTRLNVGTLEPGVRTTLFLNFDPDASRYTLKMLPPPEPLLRVGDHKNAETTPFDFTRIKSIRVYTKQLTSTKVLYFDNLRLIQWESPESRLAGIADMFGQNAKMSWPSKIYSLQDLIDRKANEASWLLANPPLTDRDEYGAALNYPKVTATGYFRTEKLGDSWWLVAPNGRLFFASSMGSIDETTSGSNETVLTGRESMFNWLPTTGNPNLRTVSGLTFGPITSASVFNFYRENLMRKYGASYSTAWLGTTRSRLLSWGMNSVGANSTDAAIASTQMPFTVLAKLSGSYKTINPGRITWGPLPDPYDPAFATAVQSNLLPHTNKYKNSKLLIGYFVGNEEAWAGTTSQEESGRYGLATATLALNATASPAKREFVRLLKLKYPTIGNLNTAWNTGYASWTAFEAGASISGVPNANAKADMADFILGLARKFFQTIRDTLKAQDPNHLYLGCRFAVYAWTPEVVRAQAEYADVLSVNYYKHLLTEKEFGAYSLVDKPWIVSEFAFGAMDMGAGFPGTVAVQGQAERAKYYKGIVDAALGLGKLVGVQWFRYTDYPVTGALKGENSNPGFLDVADFPPPALAIAAREVNSRIYSTRNVPLLTTVLDGADGSTEIGKPVSLTASLTVNGTGLALKKVSFKLVEIAPREGTIVVGTADTDQNGVAKIDWIPDDGPARSLRVEVGFGGGDGYTPASDVSTLEVLRAATAIVVPNLEAKVGEEVSLRASLARTTDSKVLSGRNLSFLVDGTVVGSALTGADGFAQLSFDTSGLSTGEHPVVVRFAEDDSYLASEGAGVLTVTAATTTQLELQASAPVRIGESASLSATLTGDGAPLEGKTVAFKVAGTQVGTATTNDQGVAALSYKIEEGPAGERPVEANFEAGDGYASSSDTDTLSVLRAPTEVVVSNLEATAGDQVALRATLSRTTDARALSGKSLEFLVDGVPVGTAMTGADGAAVHTFDTTGLSESSHSVVARFAEDDSYLASEGTGVLPLSSNAPVQLKLDTLIPVRVGETTHLSAKLLSGGQPLVGRQVLFSVAGSTPLSAITDAQGVAAVDYKIEEGPAGERLVEATFAGEKGYRRAKDSALLTVLKAPTWLDLGSPGDINAGYLLSLGKILCVGDSLTQGSISNNYRSHLTPKLAARGYTFTSVGPEPNLTTDGTNNLLRHGGMTRYKILDIAYGTLDRPDLAIGSMMSTYRPNLVLLMIGTNDRLSTITVAILKDRYNQLLDNLFAVDPNVEVVMACPPNGAPDPTTNRAEFVVMCETAVREVVAERKAAGRSISFVDMVGVLDPATDFLPGDLIHPNDSGNEKIATRFYEGVQAREIRLPVASGEEARLRAVLRRTTDDRTLSGKRIEFFLDGLSVGEAWTTNGVAELVVPAGVLTPGVHAVEARFVEDDSYLASQRLGSVAQPAPGAAQLEMSTPTPVKVGETAHLSAKLTVNGTPLTGHDVSFKIAGVEVGTATTDATGVASLDRKIDEGPAGTWSVEATFSGGGGYGATSDADALSVLRAPSAVVVPSLDARVGVPVTLRATLSRTTDAKALAGKSVSFLVDGLAVGSAMTGADGVAELAFTTYFMTVGAHPVVARFTEDDSYLASEGSSSLTLAAAKQALEMWVGPRTVYVGENVVYRATLKLTGTSQFVLGKTIAFYLDGRLIGTGITGGTQGFAEVSEVLPEDTLSGSHTIRAEFVEDADYLGVTGTATLTAKKAPTYVWVGNRNAVPGQIVQFRSNVKNEFTKALLLGKTLNSKVGTWLVWSAITAGTSGYAEANLQLPEGMPAGDYVITSTFDGDQSYEPSTSNGTLTVSRAAVSLWIGNRSGRAGQSVQYRATIQNSTSKTYLSGKVLRVKMGTTVIGTATSGADGYITINSVIPSNTPVGTQTLTVEFDGDAAYKPGTASGTLTVNP